MISIQLNANKSRSENTLRCIVLCLNVELAGKCVLIDIKFHIFELGVCTSISKEMVSEVYIGVNALAEFLSGCFLLCFDL